MAFRFRKSIKLGPLRINFSKSGVGYSVGGKFARITKKANGNIRTTTTIPGTGITNVNEFSTKNSSSTADRPYDRRKETAAEIAQRMDREREAMERAAKKWEHVHFELSNVLAENEDGVRRQTLLRKIKERRAPFDTERVVSLIEVDNSDKPAFIVTVNGYCIGEVPAKAAASISEKWDRIDCVSSFDPYSRSTAHDHYGAEVTVRFFAEQKEN